MASPKPNETSKLIELGEFRIDQLRRTISGPAGEVTVEPKIMAVLLMFAGRPGEVITRREFIDFIWAEEYGGDESLTRAVSHLRKVFADSRGHQAHIETIPRTGYRLIVENRLMGANARGVTCRQRLTAGAVMIVVVLALSVYWKGADSPAPAAVSPASVILAVLPFDINSDVTEDVSLAYGLAEEILSELSQGSSIAVISGNSSFKFIGEAKKDLAALTRQLNVTHVIDGLVQWSPDGLRVGVRLIETGTGSVMWSDVVTRPESEIYTIPNFVVAGVHKALGIDNFETGPQTNPPDPQAYAAYLQAKALAREAYDWNLTRAINLLEDAVKRDPDLGEAWAALAWARMDLAHVVSSGEASELNGKSPDYLLAARRDANAALVIDPASVDALLVLAVINLVDRLDTLIETESRITSLLVRDPSHPNVNMRMGMLQMSVGRWQEALRYMKVALDMDPLSALTGFYYATALIGSKRAGDFHAYIEKKGASELYRRSYPWLVETLLLRDFQSARDFFTPLNDGKEYFTKGLGMRENIDVGSPRATRLIQLIDRLVASAEQAETSIDQTIGLNMLRAAEDDLIPVSWVFQLLAAAGQNDTAFDLARERISLGEVWYRELLLMPAFGAALHEPRVMELFEATGQLDYWWQTGKWPDYCTDPELPYDCEEAALQFRERNALQ